MRTACTSRSRTGGAAVAAAALLTLTAGCGASADEPTSHPTKDTSITADVGERFTLTVDENGSTGERWYLATPRPDGSVVRDRGQRYEADAGADKSPGTGGHRTFTFEATGAGRTRIVLLHCLAYECNGSTASPAPQTTAPSSSTHKPERITYTVTVS
ncbi:protease inhibitor I42 family protein [Streptomyces sp. NPDC005202]|uniref:protease inhibitor I42 family protein n=1 Tax=Streptomyces sp. NPDC005202 TaxID=3157021 RepID=UPI0033A7FAC4